MKPTLIVYDIETAPNIALTWGIYDQNVSKVVQPMYVLGFSYKELGKPVKACYIWDFKLYKTDPTNDIEVIKKWIEVASGADILIGHNSKQFDDRVMIGRAMVHNLDPPIPFQQVDTLRSTKQVAKFDSNKLDDLGEKFGIGRKLKHSGIELWWACMQGDKKAQKKMVDYNKQDVILTEKLYKHQLKYIKNHPSLSVFLRDSEACTKCGGHNITVDKKYRATNTNLYAYCHCNDCGSRMKFRVPEPQLQKMQYTGV